MGSSIASLASAGQSWLTAVGVGVAYGTMTLQQLTYFLAAAEHGSFTAAADVLRLARPSVSEQVAHLEAELGVALFVRAGRRLQLTDAGRLLVPEAERTLASAREAVDAVRRARTLTGGTASLGTFSTADHLLLPRLVEDFARAYPEVAVRVVGENSSQLADAVRAGRLEAGLVALPVDADGLEVGAAVAEFEVVYASADPARVREPVTVERLATGPPRPRRGDGPRPPPPPLPPPLHETFAFIARRNVSPSPATRALMTLAERHLAAIRSPPRAPRSRR